MPYKDKASRYATIKRSVAKNPAHYRALNNAFQNGQKRLDYILRRNYKISLEEYNYLVTRQSGCCAICNNPPKMTTKEKRLHVDHCHSTGVVRGLLCGNCNRKLSILEDRLWLEKVKVYLENS